MKEIWQLRVWHGNMAPSDCLARGRRMGLVTRLLLDRDDACLQQLLTLHAARKAAGQTGLISYSDIERRYVAPSRRPPADRGDDAGVLGRGLLVASADGNEAFSFDATGKRPRSCAVTAGKH